MITPFGPVAMQYAQLLGDLDAIICEPGDLMPAYLEAVARRERGQQVYGMLLIDDHRSHVINRTSAAILRQKSGYDERRYMFDRLAAGTLEVNGAQSAEIFSRVDGALRQIASEFFQMCSGMLVRSHTDYQRLQPLLMRPRPFEILVHEPAIPIVTRVRPERPGLVVWGPTHPSVELGVIGLALSDFHGDVLFVTADGEPIADLPLICVRADDPRVAGALATASCVATTQSGDPGFAISFARRGYGILAPQSSGAHEYVRNVVLYDVGAVRNIRVGAAMAIAQPATVRRLPDPPPRLTVAPVPFVEREDLPLVSVIIPTFNRAEDLQLCLSCIAAQTYPNIEAVVVNDAGDSVDAIVAAFPFVRLVNKTKNEGCYPAMRDGWLASRGEYVAFLADDDWFYPDAVERLAFAAVRSGASVAHGTGLVRVQERVDSGGYLTSGYNSSVFNDSTTPADAMIATPIAGHSLLWRRGVFDEIGFWRMDMAIADQEIQLRAAQKYTFAFVDQMAVEWRIRGGGSSFKNEGAEELRRIYEDLHPEPGRELLRQMRVNTIENVANHAKSRKPGEPVFAATVNMIRPPATGAEN
jgi:GT2 family glycosyltransferase